mmetsp:Transcript_146875/g.366295  ORF Transcript_146875/g.366295 Transcript_146875/m.366295 type:complete len:215 (+) Transcript_146875:719-1363(+)
MLKHLTACTSCSTENAFLWPGGRVKSKILTALSTEPEKSVGLVGWKAKQVTPSKWSCRILVTGLDSSSSVTLILPIGPSVLAAQDRIRAQSKILMLPSRQPVATDRPSAEKATDRQACLCDAVYRSLISGAFLGMFMPTGCSAGLPAAAAAGGTGGCRRGSLGAGGGGVGTEAGGGAAGGVSRLRVRSLGPSGGTGEQLMGTHAPACSSPNAHL